MFQLFKHVDMIFFHLQRYKKKSLSNTMTFNFCIILHRAMSVFAYFDKKTPHGEVRTAVWSIFELDTICFLDLVSNQLVPEVYGFVRFAL